MDMQNWYDGTQLDITSLNTSQEQVVLSPPDTALLCVAGPGSGKTRTLTYRLAYLSIMCGIPPARLRAVTFSRSATREMENRLKDIDPSLKDVHISTIHRLCRDVIKETQGAVIETGDFQCYIDRSVDEGKPTPKKPDHAIEAALIRVLEEDSDTENHKRLYFKIAKKLFGKSVMDFSLEDVAKALLKLNDKGSPKEQAAQYITLQKMKRHCHHEKHIPGAKLSDFSFNFAKRIQPLLTLEMYAGIYRHYSDILQEWKLLDYTDQGIFAHLGLMRCSEETRQHLQEQWDILAVDEFQDVDAIQFAVFCLLCAGNTQLNAVGDPDQAIYGFRGGDSIFISNFKSSFPDTQILKLDTNYRSHSEIIDVAYSAVKDIAQPYRAKGESSKGVGGTVGFKRIKDIEDMTPFGTCGVLAYTNKKLHKISDQLLREGVICATHTRWRSDLNISRSPYRVVSQTLRAFNMLTEQVDFDREAFLESAQNMKGIKDAIMKAEGETLSELRKESDKVRRYVTFLNSLKGLKDTDRIQSIVNPDVFNEFDNIEKTGLIPAYRKIFKELDFSETYDDLIKLTHIKLYTIHRVKGLEFDSVFLDTEDFTKPFVKDNIDEFRRLLFVALSRAKQNLFLLESKEQGGYIVSPVVQAIQTFLTESEPTPKVTTTPSAADISDAEKYEAIKDVVDRVGYGLARDDHLTDDEKLKEWVAILEWAVKMLPEGYEQTREMFLEGIANPRREDYDAELLRRQREVWANTRIAIVNQRSIPTSAGVTRMAHFT